MRPSNPKNECYTPSYFVDTIRDFAGTFHLDPFSCEKANEITKAEFYLDERQDSLLLDWLSLVTVVYPTFWVNPPYSRDLIQKCIAKTLTYAGRAEIFLLVNSQTSSKAYRSCVRACSAMLFPHKRIQFENPYNEFNNKNDRDQTLFYFGRNAIKLKERLNVLGEVIVKANTND
ncbi:MAG: DNA N-6-adenine-methyltransferase [Pseudanabaena sp.]|jgi:hypothetical protein